MAKAIFLDRDGVLNKLIFNPSTGEFESPHKVADLKFTKNLTKNLTKIRDMGYLLFLISNQPSFAKGKTSMENIRAIHDKLDKKLKSAGIVFSEYYYCYHQASDNCECRKPKTYFLKQAIKKYKIKKSDSWFIGDQDTDIQCGNRVDINTILIETKESEKKRIKSNPLATFKDLASAIKWIGEIE